VSIRKLFALLLALAMLFAPAVTYAAMPMAMGQGGMQMMAMGPCEAPPSKTDHKSPAKNCCMAMCMAIAVAPDAPVALLEPRHAASYFAAPTSWHGHLGETATPPPRIA
jgi:hypothetical protein